MVQRRGKERREKTRKEREETRKKKKQEDTKKWQEARSEDERGEEKRHEAKPDSSHFKFSSLTIALHYILNYQSPFFLFFFICSTSLNQLYTDHLSIFRTPIKENTKRWRTSTSNPIALNRPHHSAQSRHSQAFPIIAELLKRSTFIRNDCYINAIGMGGDGAVLGQRGCDADANYRGRFFHVVLLFGQKRIGEPHHSVPRPWIRQGMNHILGWK